MKVEIIQSNRKTMSLEVTGDGILKVRAPYRVTKEQVKQFIADHMDWIREKEMIAKARREVREAMPKYTEEELNLMSKKARKVLTEKVAYYAPLVGVSYGRIAIRKQKTRWGSCSSKGNLNFNMLLMEMPEEVIDYVVVHELCHRKEMNHSRFFWAEVEKILPDYRIRRKWLKEHGSEIMSRS